MSLTIGLPVSRLISATVNLAAAGAAAPNFSTCLLLGTSTVINVTERSRNYTSLAAIATDFGTSAEEYLGAVAWFSQSPKPSSLLIGRWAKTASSGQLIGGALSATNQLVATWAAISDGSFKVSINGASAVAITGLDFHTTPVTTLNGVATAITTALSSHGAPVVTYDATYRRFIITAADTGASSTISFLTTDTGVGTDISGMLAMRSTSSGAYTADGIAAESALACVTIFDTYWSDQWYGLAIPSAIDTDHSAVAGYIEAATAAHIYGVTSSDAAILTSSTSTNIAYTLKTAGYTHSLVQYSSTSAYAVLSLMARILTTDWTANNTAITLMYKSEPGITAETLTETQMGYLEGYNCNVFVQYNNNTAIIEPGKVSSGDYIDTIIGSDWLKTTVQTDLYDALKASTTKIPQTDPGMHILATIIEADCGQGVNNGLLAPGIWTGTSFGQIKTGDYLPKGFYVYQPSISSQSDADRAARKSVAFQVAAVLGGAVHTASVAINVAN
jgi:Protein of unknown function (DUF3383)